MEGGHAVLYANRGGQILKVHGGPLIVRLTAEMSGGAAAVARGAVEGASREGAVTAYAIVREGAPLTLQTVERLRTGLAGTLEAVGRLLFGTPTSCGVVQGVAIEASGLSAEAIARLLPSGGFSGRYIPITLVDHWLQTGAGRLVEGGAAKLVYGAATSTVTQFTLGILQVGARLAAPVVTRQGAALGTTVGPAPPATTPPPGNRGVRPTPPARGGGAPELSMPLRMERAALDIVGRWGTTPTPPQIMEIRLALMDLISGWLVLNEAARAEFGDMLERAGMSPSAARSVVE
jgi:hypothetical protein